MKKYKAILFDLDGTLIPMNMKEFTDGYFKFLAAKLAPLHIETKTLIDTIWKGTATMMANDGRRTNADAFWEQFTEILGIPEQPARSLCDDFYSNEFMAAKRFTKDNPLAKEAVKAAKEAAGTVVLATNPIFPMAGQITRLSWVGLTTDDFNLVTAYETDSFAKPSPVYYDTVCERIGVAPEDCLMVGNDEYEDMYAASVAGIDGYLVTDTMIGSKEHPWNGMRGIFPEMIDFLKSLK